MKKTILFSVLVLMSAGQLVTARDTLRFVFDPNTRQLTITYQVSQKYKDAVLIFDITKNSFSKCLSDKLESDPYSFKGKECYKIVKGGTWKRMDCFDSVQCTEMDFILLKEWSSQEQLPCNFERIVEVLPRTVVLETASKDPKGKGFPLWIVIVLIAIILAAAGAWFVWKKRCKAGDSQKNIGEKAEELGLEVVEVVASEKRIGLEHVRQALENYYILDMKQDYKDSAVHHIYLHHTAVKKMYDFFKSSIEGAELTQETGCYFIGCWEYANDAHSAFDISVEDIVEPGDDLVPGEFSFHFGKKIGVRLNALIDNYSQKSGRDFVQTVWMHSHPGLGLFLSSHDLLVQRQLAYPEAPGRMAAFVIDTNTPDWNFAVFVAKSNGSMNNKEDNPHIYSLDELYQWSRNVHSGKKESAPAFDVAVDLNDYHAIQVQQGNSQTRKLFFSGKAINGMDDMVYEAAGSSKLGGYLVGKKDADGNFLLEDCVPHTSDNVIGLFVVDGKTAYQDIIQCYTGQSDVLCVLVWRSEDEVWIVTRPDSASDFGSYSEVAVYPMKQMKEWLRRRRIYK